MGEQAAAGVWGYSSAGRAPALQAGGQGFEPLYLQSTGAKGGREPSVDDRAEARESAAVP